MMQPKNPVKIAAIGLFVLATLYPVGLATLGIYLRVPEPCMHNHGTIKSSVHKSPPATSEDAVNRNSLRYRYLLK